MQHHDKDAAADRAEANAEKTAARLNALIAGLSREAITVLTGACERLGVETTDHPEVIEESVAMALRDCVNIPDPQQAREDAREGTPT